MPPLHSTGPPHLNATPNLSVIVPFYNEEDNVVPMHAAIAAAVEPLGIALEIVFVDDGSTDRTLERATAVAQGDHRVKVVKFRRNFGQTAAMAAGIEQACGQIIVTMDGDLQNDPRDIEVLLAKLDEGYDLVVGWRANRQDKLVSRKVPSVIANWLLGTITGVPLNDTGCSLKAYRGSLIKGIPLYSDMHRFIPAMASIAGPRVAEIKVRHHARKFGQSKYGLSRIYKVLIDLMVIKTVTSFAARPLMWFSLLATPLLFLGLGALGFALFSLFTTPEGIPLPVAGAGVLLTLSALILIAGGIFGELVYRLGDVSQNDFCRLTSTVWVHPDGDACDTGGHS